jgi:hypothetical protein
MALLTAPYHLEVVERWNQFRTKILIAMFSGLNPVFKSSQRVEKKPIMSQIKLAVVLIMSLATLCSIASAQESGKTLPQKAEVTNVTVPADCAKVEYRPGEI